MRHLARYCTICTILKKVKNTHGGVLLLVRLACKFTESIIPTWVFFTFFKLYKWYQIGQSITNDKLMLANKNPRNLFPLFRHQNFYSQNSVKCAKRQSSFKIKACRYFNFCISIVIFSIVKFCDSKYNQENITVSTNKKKVLNGQNQKGQTKRTCKYVKQKIFLKIIENTSVEFSSFLEFRWIGRRD